MSATATKQNYTIKHRLTGATLWTGDADSLRDALQIAVKDKTNLAGAYLARANLARADLTGADLTGADLAGANLTRAYLTRAYLTRAYLARADLTGADLAGAYLAGANLAGANLTGADLTGADLAGANLTPIRDDFWAVLSAQPAEVIALRAALMAGKVDGSQYEGDCACLVGTIANAALCQYDRLKILKPNSDRPAEQFFMLIHKGDTPDKCQAAKIALEWTDVWLSNMRAAAKAGAFDVSG